MPPKARYSICTITSQDISIISRREEIKKMGYTDLEIYEAGIDILEKGVDNVVGKE